MERNTRASPRTPRRGGAKQREMATSTAAMKMRSPLKITEISFPSSDELSDSSDGLGLPAHMQDDPTHELPLLPNNLTRHSAKINKESEISDFIQTLLERKGVLDKAKSLEPSKHAKLEKIKKAVGTLASLRGDEVTAPEESAPFLNLSSNHIRNHDHDHNPKRSSNRRSSNPDLRLVASKFSKTLLAEEQGRHPHEPRSGRRHSIGSLQPEAATTDPKREKTSRKGGRSSGSTKEKESNNHRRGEASMRANKRSESDSGPNKHSTESGQQSINDVLRKGHESRKESDHKDGKKMGEQRTKKVGKTISDVESGRSKKAREHKPTKVEQMNGSKNLLEQKPKKDEEQLPKKDRQKDKKELGESSQKDKEKRKDTEGRKHHHHVEHKVKKNAEPQTKKDEQQPRRREGEKPKKIISTGVDTPSETPTTTKRTSSQPASRRSSSQGRKRHGRSRRSSDIEKLHSSESIIRFSTQDTSLRESTSSRHGQGITRGDSESARRRSRRETSVGRSSRDALAGSRGTNVRGSSRDVRGSSRNNLLEYHSNHNSQAKFSPLQDSPAVRTPLKRRLHKTGSYGSLMHVSPMPRNRKLSVGGRADSDPMIKVVISPEQKPKQGVGSRLAKI